MMPGCSTHSHAGMLTSLMFVDLLAVNNNNNNNNHNHRHSKINYYYYYCNYVPVVMNLTSIA